MTKRVTATVLRWSARIWSIASIGVLCAFLIGEGPPPLTVMVMLFPWSVLLGLILAWRFERTGGIIAAASFLLFYALHYLSSGKFPTGYAFLLIAAPSVIFVVCGYLSAKDQKTVIAEPAP